MIKDDKIEVLTKDVALLCSKVPLAVYLAIRERIFFKGQEMFVHKEYSFG